MLELDFSQKLGDLQLEVNTQLPTESITAVFGLSGAGKTSLINVIGGLTKPNKGRIVLNGRTLVDVEKRICLPPEQRHIGYVFQDARLFPHYRVKSNLRYGMAPKMKTRFDDIVELLGIEKLLNRYPITLSGGEKQRVAIGRALLTAPEILLMDEPLASLDLPRKRELLPYLEKLSQDVKIPILYVSHSLDEILRLADKVIVMAQGKVKAFGPLEDVWASSALRPWLQQETLSSVVSAKVHSQHPDYDMTAVIVGGQKLWVPRVEMQQGAEVRIRIDASDVSLVLEKPQVSSIRNILAAEVIEWIEDGEQVDVKLDLGEEHYLWARITRWARDELSIRKGRKVFAQMKSVSLSRQL
ncbi:molybdenum ABC transporter ATP-binding protein ModC [Providencia rettgeri]|uniref:molybdenum ABC transporter ATP-binding protein ModC n=1 Tax=Providencia TaxID=586 RepID=UPI001CFEF379|nr:MULTISPECIES: molybdenum ABC transporter ATP-binding protein ModC [Providencia]EIU7555873.1 molybdenum ABC transporter ATP-binding protein ModC [Providencia rettgeri]MCB4840111.1 molybdenum ABC transporter ATP-binding protein ModC [Providencia rettgeri]MCG5277598.1 molybdenum ABC transporter ATP-binding protein ModC [Providencia rettgeri]MCG9509047.1 molybdenum ABC transporter ATP-binding protein ModC [Providencia rettgeri]